MSLIWIIDDEAAICTSLGKAFQRLGHQTQTFSSVEPALKISKTSNSSHPDVIVLDVRLPGMDGLSAANAFKTTLPDVPVIMMTAFGDLATAVKAIEGRVFDYLTKPFDLDAMQTAVQRALASRVANRITLNESNVNSNQLVNPLQSSSAAMQSVFKRIALAAAAGDCPILITGERGTGKELIARAIHENSDTRNETFITFSPISLESSQIESELYGYDEGTFSGVDRAKAGVLELAGSGTVLIKEIGDMPLNQQIKLLRVLEQKEFFPMSSIQSRSLQARVLATTSRNLSKMVQQGDFHEDLYSRLTVFTIDVPSLRQRAEDIVSLAKHFLAQHGYSPEGDCLDSATVATLMQHTWPGNIRELRNAMEHAAILARGQRIFPEHLPEWRSYSRDSDSNDTSIEEIKDIPGQLDRLIRLWLRELSSTSGNSIENALVSPSSNPNPEDVGTIYDSFLGVVEPSLIRALLETAQGNRAAVANALGLHRSTLRQKMRRHKIDEV